MSVQPTDVVTIGYGSAQVVKFMIPRGVLSLAHLTSMWQAQVDKHETISNNIHDLLAKLACELDTEQLDHLFRCFQSSWGGSVRNMERLLDFIRRLGEEDSEGNVAPKVLWVPCARGAIAN